MQSFNIILIIFKSLADTLETLYWTLINTLLHIYSLPIEVHCKNNYRIHLIFLCKFLYTVFKVNFTFVSSFYTVF